MKRCFIALALTRMARESLEEPQQTVHHLEPHAKPVAPGNLHATLKFLGPSTDAQIASLKESLGILAADTPEVHAEVFGLGAFPDVRRPRAIYAGIGTGKDLLIKLMGAVEDICTPLGYAAEPQPRLPHVTLARVPTPRPSPRLEAWLLAQKARPWGPLDGGAIILYESRSRNGGSVYEPLARLPTKAA